MRKVKRHRRNLLVLGLVMAWTLLASHSSALALNPSLDVSQYAHTAWTIRDGFSLGAVFAMAQTPDGYLWLGSEFGLFRFDGVHAAPLATTVRVSNSPTAPTSARHARWHSLDRHVCRPCKLEWRQADRVSGGWRTFRHITARRPRGNGVGRDSGDSRGPRRADCAQSEVASAQCYGQDGAFGTFVWSLGEDSVRHSLGRRRVWSLWRWKPGPPRRYATPGMRLGDMTRSDDGD